jgi:2'-5' RNA ligase
VSSRLFLAVAPDDATRHGLATRLTDVLDGRPMPGRPVAVENWHITLRFLGTTSDVERDLVIGWLDRHVQTAPFRMRFHGLGAFPRPARASILWVGVAAGAGELGSLAGECEEAAVAAGLEPEGRPFHPHLTLSRMRPPVDVSALIEAEPLGVVMDVGTVTLYRSLLGRGPTRYEEVETVDLR